MLLLVLLTYNTKIDPCQMFNFAAFAGKGEVTKSLRAFGLKGASHDLS